jgi:hypothetical protein
MRFRSRRDIWVSLVIYGTVAILIIPLFLLVNSGASVGVIIMAIFCIAVVGLLLWIYYGTYYIIDNTHIKYFSGPIRGKIEIEKIHTIIKDKNLYTGLRPATAMKGLVVKYGKYDEIYFSPDTNESFIEELRRRSPQIKIEKYK